MFSQVNDWRLSADGPGDPKILSDEVEREITLLLRAKAPELSPKNSFRIAANLVETAATMILSLQSRVASLEAEQEKARAQETEWESLLTRWRDIAVGLKAQVRDLEIKLAHANQRMMQAEVRAQNAEEDILNSKQGSLELCDQVIAAFGMGTLIDRVNSAARESPSGDKGAREFAGSC